MVIPRIEFSIDENNPIAGVKVMSLVDEPAIESDFVYFNKQKSNFIALKGEKFKQVVAGLALIPDKDILRYDALGEPYYGYFTAETVEKSRTKFHKEEKTSMVNTDHDSENYIEAFLIESFIIDSDERLADVKARGISEATIGSWFVAYKIEDKDTFQRVIDGELKGFSVEIFLSHTFGRRIDNNLKEKTEQEAMNQLLKNLVKDFVKEAMSEVQKTAKKFEVAKTEDGKSVEYTEVGESVSVVSIDADGKEVKETAPDGDYSLDNGKIVTVASGIATEIKDAEEPEAQSKEAPKAEDEKMSQSVYASYTLTDGSTANVSVSSVNEVYIWDGEVSVLAATGSYDIKDGGKLHVEDGKFVGVEGTQETKEFDSNKELAKAKANFVKAVKEKEAFSKEVLSLKAEIEKLKKTPIANPTVKVDKSEEVDLSKLSNADKLRHKYNLK